MRLRRRRIVVDAKQIPADELAIHRGTQVEARDGHIGQVSEFLVNPTTGHITHLVLKEGILWNKKAVTIPAAQVDRIEQDTVYLKLDKKAVEALPSIPVNRGRSITPRRQRDHPCPISANRDGEQMAPNCLGYMSHLALIIFF